jgi:uncharacterized membrane protein YebE (DUF533 family)
MTASSLTRSLIVAATVVTSLGALAATASADSIDRRQFNQDRRIDQGVRSGTLTRGEALRLEAEQARIRELERRAKADGHVDRYERFRINQAQNAASRHIYQEKHDGQGRGFGGWRGWYGSDRGHHGHSDRRWYRWW